MNNQFNLEDELGWCAVPDAKIINPDEAVFLIELHKLSVEPEDLEDDYQLRTH